MEVGIKKILRYRDAWESLSSRAHFQQLQGQEYGALAEKSVIKFNFLKI